MTTAKDIMTSDVITASTDMSIKKISELFIKYKVNGLPVVDDDGKLIGVVTQGDLIEQRKNLHIFLRARIPTIP